MDFDFIFQTACFPYLDVRFEFIESESKIKITCDPK